MDKASKYGQFVQYDQVKERTVMLWSWWHAPRSGRKFAVVDKQTKTVAGQIKTVGIKLLEVDDSNPFYRDIDEFWKLVDKGSLVEFKHDATGKNQSIS